MTPLAHAQPNPIRFTPGARALRRPLPLVWMCALLAACGGGGDDAGAAQGSRVALSVAPSIPPGPRPA